MLIPVQVDTGHHQKAITKMAHASDEDVAAAAENEKEAVHSAAAVVMVLR